PASSRGIKLHVFEFIPRADAGSGSHRAERARSCVFAQDKVARLSLSRAQTRDLAALALNEPDPASSRRIKLNVFEFIPRADAGSGGHRAERARSCVFAQDKVARFRVYPRADAGSGGHRAE